ncbi:BnaCnng35010D [Brassica napus]|uniref:Replication factor A C-terminal domain-containing protein n=2 Tax=Brassica TaxID=3705 RepID=A0A0D3AL75_BRAOL|nr:unnamed protein product [Brassica napus]CDY59507.1 BnaCnng35010D [Brassica napus]
MESPLSLPTDEKVMFFKDVSLSPPETQLRFRLINFWEARNPIKKTLIGLKMLLIDEQGTVIQEFISPGLYKLNNLYGSKNKSVYRVADHIATVSLSWNSEMSVLHEIPSSFDEDRFRFHSYEDFDANCDLKGDFYDVLGHMKLVNGQTLIELPILDEVEIATTRHVMVHVQSHEYPCLTSMSSTRFFMEYDVQPTKDYFTWLGSNPESAKHVSAEVVTKRETLTIADIFSYMKHESAKDVFFECTATIGDVVHGSAWYYIACSGCHTKATKGPTSLICTNTKCGKVNTAGVAQYVLSPEYSITLSLVLAFDYYICDVSFCFFHNRYYAKIYVYDNSDQAVFVLLGDAGRELTGRHASELVSSTLSIAATSEETMQTGNDVCEPSKSRGDSADEESKRMCDSAEPEQAKRPRCEN